MRRRFFGCSWSTTTQTFNAVVGNSASKRGELPILQGVRSTAETFQKLFIMGDHNEGSGVSPESFLKGFNTKHINGVRGFIADNTIWVLFGDDSPLNS